MESNTKKNIFIGKAEASAGGRGRGEGETA